LHLTRVHADAGADVFFPPFNVDEWQIKEQTEFPAGPKNDYPFTILRLENLNI
jgi:2-methylisocitrate lyase-like PEP mutase family enzyme